MNLADTGAALTSLLGQEHVQLDGDTLVVYPATNEEVAAIIRKATTGGIKVAVVGGRTGVGFKENPQIIVSLSRMNKILDLDQDNMLVRVQAGINTATFQRELLAEGLYFPPDPLSKERSTLGANVATRASGPTAMSHGETGDFLLGLTAVLPNGEILEVGGKTYKNVTALDLNHFFGGSYGRLGIITELIFRLLPKPEVTCTLIHPFPSIEEAAKAASILTTRGIIPNKLELLSGEVLDRLGEKWPEAYASKAITLIEVEGYQESIDHQIEIIKDALGNQQQGLIIVSDEEAASLWKAREWAAELLSNPNNQAYHLAVAPTRLAEAIGAIQEVGRKTHSSLGLVIHGSASRLHPVLFNARENQGKLLAAELKVRIEGLGGTFLKDSLELNPDTNPDGELIAGLLQVFDPSGIMAV